MELSNEELKAYVNGVPEDDRTKTIQDSFIELATSPVIRNVHELESYKKEVVEFLKEKTFGAFPKKAEPLDMKLLFQATNGSKEREDYSFVSEEGWRLKISLQKEKQSTEEKQPVLLVLKNPDEGRWDSYSLTSGLGEKMTIARFEARGIGETGWSPSLQWHIRRSAAWTGRTIASMRVYDVLRSIETLREIRGVDPNNISIIAEGEMAAIASYAALLDGKIKTLLIKDPPATQNVASEPSGKGEAMEMLNSLRVTDLPQVAGLMFPNELVVIGELPDTYKWTENLYENLNKAGAFKRVQKSSEWLAD